MKVTEPFFQMTGAKRLFHHMVCSVAYGGGLLVLMCNPAWRHQPQSNAAFLVKGFLLVAYLSLSVATGYHLWQTAVRLRREVSGPNTGKE